MGGSMADVIKAAKEAGLKPERRKKYPQFSFLVPTLRSGSYMLYLYETSVIGNPQLACINTSIGKTRIARGDPAMHVHATAPQRRRKNDRREN